MKIIFLIIALFITSCDTAILEEVYVPESSVIEFDDIELKIYVKGERQKTKEYRIKEESPYTIKLLFRTKEPDLQSTIENIVLEISELEKRYVFKKKAIIWRAFN